MSCDGLSVSIKLLTVGSENKRPVGRTDVSSSANLRKHPFHHHRVCLVEVSQRLHFQKHSPHGSEDGCGWNCVWLIAFISTWTHRWQSLNWGTSACLCHTLKDVKLVPCILQSSSEPTRNYRLIECLVLKPSRDSVRNIFYSLCEGDILVCGSVWNRCEISLLNCLLADYISCKHVFVQAESLSHMVSFSRVTHWHKACFSEVKLWAMK